LGSPSQRPRLNKVNEVPGGIAEEGGAREAVVDVEQLVGDRLRLQTLQDFWKILDQKGDVPEWGGIARKNDAAAVMEELDGVVEVGSLEGVGRDELQAKDGLVEIPQNAAGDVGGGKVNVVDGQKGFDADDGGNLLLERRKERRWFGLDRHEAYYTPDRTHSVSEAAESCPHQPCRFAQATNTLSNKAGPVICLAIPRKAR
jgi:hypothetical protein